MTVHLEETIKKEFGSCLEHREKSGKGNEEEPLKKEKRLASSTYICIKLRLCVCFNIRKGNVYWKIPLLNTYMYFFSTAFLLLGRSVGYIVLLYMVAFFSPEFWTLWPQFHPQNISLQNPSVGWLKSFTFSFMYPSVSHFYKVVSIGYTSYVLCLVHWDFNVVLCSKKTGMKIYVITSFKFQGYVVAVHKTSNFHHNRFLELTSTKFGLQGHKRFIWNLQFCDYKSK